MANKISTGAYVIRNRSTSLVLHTETSHKPSTIIAFEQDENKYRDQQIWWVEPLAKTIADEEQEEQEDIVYNISNTACERSFDGSSSGWFHSYFSFGVAWQTWKIRKVRTGSEGDCYTISSNHSGDILGIKENKPFYYPKDEIPDDDRQCWEFVIPIVSFPAGWFQVQNTETGDLLTHQYLYSPPFLSPPPVSSKPSQDRESWGTQWTLAQVGTISPHHTYTTGRNSWYIINRLTNGLLSNHVHHKTNSRRVVAWGKIHIVNPNESLWKVELDPASNWTIMHHDTKLLLEQSTLPNGGKTKVTCAERWLNLEEPNLNRTWAFTSPMLEKSDEMRAYVQRCSQNKKMPPAYEL